MALSEDQNWTKEQLMGGGTAEQPSPSKKKGKGVEEDPMLWGIPGHLTSDEADTFAKFRAEVLKRDGDFRDTVYCFGEEEGEVWALGRWLRARKFVYDDVIAMVQEATETRKEAKAKDFYPDPVEALHVDTSLYFAQYPQLYSGVAKNGAPLFISKPGILNVDGVECITTLDGILKFHWYVMMHDFANRLRDQKKNNPGFKRFECVCILDLSQLTASKLTRRALAIIKEQAAVDAICFPETMCKMFIVNAPTFFTATWRLIRGWLDARTAGKIDVISSRATMEKKLLDFVDADQLPSDYGGKGQDTNVTLTQSMAGAARRLVTNVMYLRGHGSEVCLIHANEEAEIEVFTNSSAGAKFSVTDADAKSHIVDNVLVQHVGSGVESEQPSRKVITSQRITGPANVKVKADSNAGRFSTQNFLIVFSIYKK
jgi:hypothetical protein